MNNNEPTYLKQRFSGGQVDQDAHVIRGVKILTVGEMKGHGFHADLTTLQQVKKLIPTEGLKAKINHRGVDGVMTLNGRVKDPYIEGSSLKGDWYLNPGMPTTPSIEAIALHQPEDAGFSLTCHKTLERIGGKDYMRMTALKSCDLVDDPAGNSTLLSANGPDEEGEASELANESHETALEVEECLVTYLEEADEQGISLAEVETLRRQRVIDAGREPGAATALRNAAALEFRRLSFPELNVTGLEAIEYQRATGVPWRFTMQDFSDEDAAIERSAAIVRGRSEGATALQQRAAVTALEAKGNHASIGSAPAAVASSVDMRLVEMAAAKAELDAVLGDGSGRYGLLSAKFDNKFGPGWQKKLRLFNSKTA